MTEARELLERVLPVFETARDREGACNTCGAPVSVRHDPTCIWTVAHDALLSLAAPARGDAEKAVLVAALVEATESAIALNEERRAVILLRADKMAPMSVTTQMQVLDNRNAYFNDRTAKILADTSPAVAALLAQVVAAGWLAKRLRGRSQDWHEMRHTGEWSACDILSCSVDKEALEARAALAPGGQPCGTCGGRRAVLINPPNDADFVPCPDCTPGSPRD